MIHPDTELKFINDRIGFGIVASKTIPAGTITWALDELDMIFTPQKIASFESEIQKTMDKYCYIDNHGNWIYCWDISKYMNHSFNSNCISTAYDFELAVRDIPAGEQLTCDYGYLNVTEAFDCVPEKNELNRTRVLPTDIITFHSYWDKKLEAVFPLLNAVEQPLFKYLSKETREIATSISLGKTTMASTLNCAFINKS